MAKHIILTETILQNVRINVDLHHKIGVARVLVLPPARLIDGCDQETLALINDYFSAPKSNEECGSSDSEGFALVLDFLNHKTTL